MDCCLRMLTNLWVSWHSLSSVSSTVMTETRDQDEAEHLGWGSGAPPAYLGV